MSLQPFSIKTLRASCCFRIKYKLLKPWPACVIALRLQQFSSCSGNLVSLFPPHSLCLCCHFCLECPFSPSAWQTPTQPLTLHLNMTSLERPSPLPGRSKDNLLSHPLRVPHLSPSKHFLSAVVVSLLVGLLVHVCLLHRNVSAVRAVGLTVCSASLRLAQRGLPEIRAVRERGRLPRLSFRICPAGGTPGQSFSGSQALRCQDSSHPHPRAPGWRSKGQVREPGCPLILPVPQSPPHFSCFFETCGSA